MASKIISVRCAHQKYNDFNVELDVKWTVRDLKEHLAAVYPSNPDRDSQRLIFAGQLMKDDSFVSEYLARLPGNDQPIIHLVCKIVTLNETSSPDTNLLRHRNVQQPSSPASSASIAGNGSLQSNFNYGNLQNATAGIPFPAFQSTPNIFGMHHAWSYANYPAGMTNVHSQYNNVYMNQYFQYLQQLYGPNVMSYWSSQHQQPLQPGNGASLTPQTNMAAAPVANDVINVPANGDQRPPAMAAMNAQGGMADDEDGLHNNDWLDWIYTAIRASFLLVLITSYSSMERMTFVVLVAALLFAYHNGWFSRRRPRPVQVVQAPPPVAAPINNDGNNNQVGGDRQEPPANGVEATPPSVTNQDDSVWHVFWSTCYTFVSSFFASLIPEHPQPINL